MTCRRSSCPRVTSVETFSSMLTTSILSGRTWGHSCKHLLNHDSETQCHNLRCTISMLHKVLAKCQPAGEPGRKFSSQTPRAFPHLDTNSRKSICLSNLVQIKACQGHQWENKLQSRAPCGPCLDTGIAATSASRLQKLQNKITRCHDHSAETRDGVMENGLGGPWRSIKGHAAAATVQRAYCSVSWSAAY